MKMKRDRDEKRQKEKEEREGVTSEPCKSATVVFFFSDLLFFGLTSSAIICRTPEITIRFFELINEFHI